MANLEKKADLFLQKSLDGELSYHKEGYRLQILAGTIREKAKKDPDTNKSQKLQAIAELILKAGDALSKI